MAIVCAVLQSVYTKSLSSRKWSTKDNGLQELLEQLANLKVYVSEESSETYRILDFRKRAAGKWPVERKQKAASKTAAQINLAELPEVDAEDEPHNNRLGPLLGRAPSHPDVAKEGVDELRNVLADPLTGLLQNPWIEKQGHNDFLVMKPDIPEFNKVIPNDIFYEIEKKCVNWLDGCSINDMAQRLLHKMKYPWRR